MYIKLLTVLLLNSLLITANSLAEDALSDVRILDGINQHRPPNTRQTIGRRYIWNFMGKSYTILMTIGVEKYNSYSGNERYDIPKLVEEGRTTIGNLTREFQRIFQENKSWSPRNRVDFVLSFVQSLPYTLDDVTTSYDEFRRYAIETLIEGGGDCEDTTILMAAILRGLGESVALIFTPGHIALGVSGNFTGTAFSYQGTKYYYCETTGTGWTVGMLPASVGKTVDQIAPLTPDEVGPAPEPPKVPSPEPVFPQPKPERPKPTPETPPKPTPEETSTPEESKPEKQTTESGSVVGGVIAIIFILVGIGAPIAYLVYRFILAERDEHWQNDDSEYEDAVDSTDSSSTSALDK